VRFVHTGQSGDFWDGFETDELELAWVDECELAWENFTTQGIRNRSRDRRASTEEDK